MRQRLSSYSLVLAGISWGLLLLGALGRVQALPMLAGWPRWAVILAQACFVFFIFLNQRAQPDPLQGYHFVGLLRRLVRGPGLLAAVALGLGLAERSVSAGAPRWAGPPCWPWSTPSTWGCSWPSWPAPTMLGGR